MYTHVKCIPCAPSAFFPLKHLHATRNYRLPACLISISKNRSRNKSLNASFGFGDSCRPSAIFELLEYRYSERKNHATRTTWTDTMEMISNMSNAPNIYFQCLKNT